MRWRWPLLGAASLAGLGLLATRAPTAPGPGPGMVIAAALVVQAGAAARSDAIRARIQAQLDAGIANPAADATAAAGRGDFGLVVTGRFAALPRGVTCFTPSGQAPRTLVLYRHGDAISEQDNRWFAYADAYNRALIDRPDYPDSDLCRAALPEDRQTRRSAYAIDIAARRVEGPARSLHEAARRSGAGEVRRLLRSTPVDAIDGLGMTPLAWAVARDNRAAVDALLDAGANAWAGAEPERQGAVFWAAALARTALFERLAGMAGRPFEAWPVPYLNAALAGGSRAVVDHMLAEPHVPLRLEMVARPLPAAELLAPFLREAPGLADPLLLRAIELEGRLDLVDLALANGANPNAKNWQAGSDTALALAAHGFTEASVAIVESLLRAGADPNLLSHRKRPVWVAVRTLHLGLNFPENDRRARAIFDRLVAAGADLNLPDDQGVPPVRALLFPRRNLRDELDGGFITPQLLEMLVRNGLDLNAVWEGRRVLPLVEAQAGRDSVLAVTLRRLGARP